MSTAAVRSGSGAPAHGVGPMLRGWRERRRLSQLELSAMADVSTRHLSYVETGRSVPSRELILHLARELEVPLRDQNQFLLAAGYAPVFSEFDLSDEAMRPVADALGAILRGNEPSPTLVMDRHWNLVMANESAFALTAGVPDELLAPPMNVLRLTLRPDALAARIVNFDEVADHVIGRLRRQISLTGDPQLVELLAEVAEYVPPGFEERIDEVGGSPVAIPMRLMVDGVERSYLSVVSTFGTAVDVTASELTIEAFYEVNTAPR